MKYTIAEYKLNKVVRKLDAFNKRAQKLGVEGINYIVSPVYEKIQKVNEDESRVLTLVDIEVGNTLVSLKGWAFLAVIEHSKSGNIILKKLYDIEVPEKYRESGEYCEHCKAKRYRKYTYLVYNKDEDKIYQVGSTCINNYLGFDASLLLAHAEMIKHLDDEYLDTIGAGGFGGPKAESVVPLKKFLNGVVNCIDLYGYVSAKMARENVTDEPKIITGGEVFYALTCRTTSEKQREYIKEIITPNERSEALVDKALEWLSLQDTKKDYFYNLSVAVKNDYVTSKTANLVASLIAVYQMDLKKNEEKKAILPSNYVGVVGEKITYNMKLYNIFTIDTRFGTMNIHLFVDGLGNRYVWYTNKSNDTDVNYQVKATVKKHEEYKGVKQTVITRAKLTPLTY